MLAVWCCEQRENETTAFKSIFQKSFHSKTFIRIKSFLSLGTTVEYLENYIFNGKTKVFLLHIWPALQTNSYQRNADRKLRYTWSQYDGMLIVNKQHINVSITYQRRWQIQKERSCLQNLFLHNKQLAQSKSRITLNSLTPRPVTCIMRSCAR